MKKGKYPNTPQGARKAFNDIAGRKIKTEFKQAKFFTDPKSPGVWCADSKAGRRITIHVATGLLEVADRI